MGHQEVEEIYTGFLEDTGAKRTKKQDWIWPTDVHSICVTVRLPPHFRHSGRGFHGCRTEVGGLRRSCGTLHQGRAAGKPSPTQILGILKTVMMIILMVGVDVSSTSHRDLLCMLYACNSAEAKRATPRRRQRPTRPTKKNQRKNPKTRKEAEGVGCESGT